MIDPAAPQIAKLWLEHEGAALDGTKRKQILDLMHVYLIKQFESQVAFADTGETESQDGRD